MRRLKRYSKRHNNIFISHINNHLREYCIASVVFFIGVLIGIVFVNNLKQEQASEVTTYITTFVNNSKKGNVHVNTFNLLKNSIQSNVLIVILLWLLGSTVIGLLLVYLIVTFKGFCLGYTISIIVYSLGKLKGTLFIASTILLKNIIAIPAILSLAVSGMKLYKSIMQDRRKENVKIEVLRHTIFSVFILLVLIFSSIIEVYLSQGIFKYCLKYL